MPDQRCWPLAYVVSPVRARSRQRISTDMVHSKRIELRLATSTRTVHTVQVMQGWWNHNSMLLDIYSNCILTPPSVESGHFVHH